ncbi:M23 family metallopeptidase [Actinophytocola algeriensis]|jgi:murein DD-endopeptidase MepM/ murein hydrolase activator NlpD|uniref:Murein DD-endopeptidase MepM/ murein hydrolase activator NlpD n=1 Tax=Actinophytocola algeriensis TaxID=1768010 RepID=A0A7W7VH94_9PSEU|nr:M23 family metallopeptidase [Actinophytocola algeriensis]MBB4909840.1 murein DD-endopeptidase MepM/ murein hydrolase activator NlpD [Actinophytocola algeriensis]MBE1475830.1 murein DD-endopeptidase MepM/ murein hydrolase activator NlpD [Actinophytocola algeriensis]
MSLRLIGAFVAAVTAALTLAAPASADSTDVGAQSVNLRTPFDCGQVWNANTRTNHNPQLAVDFQRSNALGQNVRSSAAGVVETRRDLGNTSYGKYIVVRHAEGWKTLYAHLYSFNVSVGQNVNTGTIIGKVGSTGGSTGPHLHYEQRLNGVVQRVVLNGVRITYYGNTTITSSTGC